jgi:hypothetical protein
MNGQHATREQAFYHQEIQYDANSTVVEHLCSREWRSELIRETNISGVAWDAKTNSVRLWAKELRFVEAAKHKLDALPARPLSAAAP